MFVARFCVSGKVIHKRIAWQIVFPQPNRIVDKHSKDVSDINISQRKPQSMYRQVISHSGAYSRFFLLLFSPLDPYPAGLVLMDR